MSVVIFDGVTVIVEIALSASTGTSGVWDASQWDSATWGPDEVWSDVSAYVRSFSTSRRFAREVQAWEAGGATLTLDNRDARFSMDNVSGPYATGGISGVRPWRPVRIRAVESGVTYPIYRGYAKDFVESYAQPAPAGRGDAIVTVPCADEWARLSAYDGPALSPVGAGDTFGARVHRWLNTAGYTGARVVDVGTATMQATTLANSAVSGLRLTADSEGGAVWVGPEGEIHGARRYALVEESRSITSQVTFGDGGGEVPYTDIQLSAPGDQITNIASYTRVGGAVQTSADAASRALYGDRAETRTDLVCETDVQAATLAAWKVGRFRTPERRVTSVTIAARRSDVPWSVALGLRERDLVTVVRRAPGGLTITQYCHVSGTKHRVSKRPSRWETTFELASATPYRAFASSKWDTAVWGAFDGDPAGAAWFY